MIMVEFCRSNMDSWTQEVYDELEQNPEWSDVEIIESGCLGYCGQCYIQPIVLVEGDLVVADSPEDLLKEIKKYIKKKQELDQQWRDLGF